MLKRNDIGPQAYRDAMAHFAGAVHIVTTAGPAGTRGTTVIAACSVSDSPPTVLVCLNRENTNNELFLKNRVFALNTLSEKHCNLSAAFAGLTGLQPSERFALGEWDTLASGVPTLKDALAVFDCELAEVHDLATHRVLFGRVMGLRIGGDAGPLIYHRRSYHVLQDEVLGAIGSSASAD